MQLMKVWRDRDTRAHIGRVTTPKHTKDNITLAVHV